MGGIRKMIDKGIAYWKRNGFRGTVKRALRKAVLAKPVDYDRWFTAHAVTAEELAYLSVHPIEDPQLYLMTRSGVQRTPDARYRFAEAHREYPQAELFYADHDYAEADGRHLSNPSCKPEFDEYYLRSMNYIGGAVAVTESLIARAMTEEEAAAVRGERPWELSSREWHALLLRLAQQAEKIVRIPRILFHEPKAYFADYRCSYDGTCGTVSEEELPGSCGAAAGGKLQKSSSQPLLSVIIPSRDHVGELRDCVESLFSLGGCERLELLIAENHSSEPETFAYYEELARAHACVRVLHWQREFNYSAINNYAAGEAKGEYLLFLNNDTRVKEKGALAAMLRLAKDPAVGAVGARLFYADGTIQHAGVVLGFGKLAGHAFEGMRCDEYEQVPFAHAVRQVSAVTAACMLVRASDFWSVGGFDERLRVAYNDIDFCLKLRADGKKILYCPQAQLYHLESQTRGLEMTSEKAGRIREESAYFLEKWQSTIDAGDPFYNPNLTLEQADYTLRR